MSGSSAASEDNCGGDDAYFTQNVGYGGAGRCNNDDDSSTIVMHWPISNQEKDQQMR